MEYITAIPEDKMTPELQQNKDDAMETMRFLHGTTAEIIQLGKDKGAEQYFKDEY